MADQVEPRVICWFSAGITSAVAAKLAVEKYGTERTEVVYCDTKSEHPDNDRFVADCEKWLGKPIVKISSDDYADIWDVFRKTRWLVGPAGARCTTELKKVPRNKFQRPDDIHVFGFDAKEQGRIERFRKNNPEITLEAPLADNGVTKDECLRIVQQEGIELPVMYKLGFRNNNCIPCPKGGMGYFNHIRKHFPEAFDKMAKMERELGATILSKRTKGKRIRIYLDELDPDAGNYKAEPAISCGISCGVETAPEAAVTEIEPKKAKPFLRWAGGKRSFVDKIGPALQKHFDMHEGAYYEPFLGGAAMALHVGNNLPHVPMFLGDVLDELVTTYQEIRDNPLKVATLLYEMSAWGSEEKHYYAIRNTEPDTPVEAAARMIYLNAHSFNGLYRRNKEGGFNVPYGKKKDRITDGLLERLGDASAALARADICAQDFERTIETAKDGDLIYADPPYHETFVSYSEEGFCGVGQERLATELYKAHCRGAAFICHNSDTEKVRWWYNEFAALVPTGEKRSINRDGEGRGKADCLIITNRPQLLSFS